MEEATLLKEIRNYWEAAAQCPTDQDGLRPVARDPYLQSIIESTIERFLYPEASLLDIGCGDGLSTLRFASKVDRTVGVDYIETFVKTAQGYAVREGIDNISFHKADILNLEPIKQKYGLFDVVITIRCLINLPDWETQVFALRQIAQIIKPGGLFIISEGWREEFNMLNFYRQVVTLSEMKVVQYNCLISRELFEDEVLSSFSIQDYISPCGLYLFISRILQPLFTKPEPARHTHRINKVAAEIVSTGIGNGTFKECDYSSLYILRKL